MTQDRVTDSAGGTDRELLDNHIAQLFYKTPAQLATLVGDIAERVLPTKRPDSAFLTRYRKFDYAEEVAKIEFSYQPRNVDDFLDEFRGYFENMINFDAPGVMYNVHPNVNVVGQAASFVASIANPNLCMDIPAGRVLVIEKAVAAYLASLVGWSADDARGVFTFGGKGTLLYALKMALLRCDPKHRELGIHDKHLVVSNDLGHPAHIEICNWTGLGQDSCIRLPTVAGAVVVEELHDTLERAGQEGHQVPLIILNGLTTNNHSFDRIAEVASIRDEFVAKYKLAYKPWIHVDSVLGWVFLIAGRYNFATNPLAIEPEVLDYLGRKVEQARAIGYADSFAADFHKTGFCAYASSVLIVRQQKDLFEIQGHYAESSDLAFTEYAPYDYTLESSRSPHGPVSAYGSLQTLGVEGFMHILANQTAAFKALKRWLAELANAVVCNLEEDSNLVFVAFLPQDLKGLSIDADLSTEDAETIREFNTRFYAFLVRKAEREALPVYFSVSRSYRYQGLALGCLKLYSFNSTLNLNNARAVFDMLLKLLTEYENFRGVIAPAGSFDFTRTSGDAHV